MAPEVEKQWLEWIDLQLNDISKSKKISGTSILKLNANKPMEGVVYALQYKISNHDLLQSFIKIEDQVLKEQISLGAVRDGHPRYDLLDIAEKVCKQGSS